MRVVMSLSWASPWNSVALSHPSAAIDSVVREVDWNIGRRELIAQTVRNAYRLWRAAKAADAVIVCTTSLDAIAAALALRLRPGVTLALWDFLLPRSPITRRVARLAFRRVDRWMIIRRGDAESFARDLGARDCIFVPFPSFAARTEPSAGDGSVYAAGSAHRDWTCLIDAAGGLDMNVLISTNDAVDIPAAVRSRVEVRPLSSPEVGRTNIDRAGTVCVPLHETELPSGPVVIVDAMAMGKVVVAADVNGSRDYIADGKTGYLYPAGDANALRDALRKATEPGSTEIAQAAQHFAASELDPMHVLATMIAHLDQARSAR